MTDTDPVIIRTPGILGGTPCFRGTRVPGAQLFIELTAHPELIRQVFCAEFPTVSLADAQAALTLAAELLARHAPLVPPTLEHVKESLARHQEKLVAMGLQQIRCFGSVARGKATWGSDVDLLVAPRSEVLERLSLLDLVRWKDDIGAMLGGYGVDLTVDRGADSFRTLEIAARALAEAAVVWRAPE